MAKIRVNGVAAVGIIYRASNPSQIFLEVKDDGHPIVHARRKLCFIGGNWIGEHAKKDQNTLDTFRREFNEEITFERPLRNSLEYALLGVASEENFAPTPDPSMVPDADDSFALASVKETILRKTLLFADYINTIPKAVLDAADPGNTRDGFSGLVTYFQVGLHESAWKQLAALQQKFNNLSNESVTIMTSLGEILERGMQFAFAHDRVMRDFFFSHGISEAKNMPVVKGTESLRLGVPILAYEEYVERYDIARRP